MDVGGDVVDVVVVREDILYSNRKSHCYQIPGMNLRFVLD